MRELAAARGAADRRAFVGGAALVLSELVDPGQLPAARRRRALARARRLRRSEFSVSRAATGACSV